MLPKTSKYIHGPDLPLRLDTKFGRKTWGGKRLTNHTTQKRPVMGETSVCTRMKHTQIARIHITGCVRSVKTGAALPFIFFGPALAFQ